MSTCAICYDDVELANATCPSCNDTFCKTCFETYLLTKELTACCASCNHPWSDDFVDSNADDKFRNGALRAHRSKIMVDQEEARLPELQERARRYKLALKKKRVGAPYYIREMIASYGQPIESKAFTHDTKHCRLCKDDDHCTLAYESAKQQTMHDAATDLYGGGWSVREATKAVKKVVMRPCPSACRGFMDTAGICGICDQTFCIKCHVVLEKSAPGSEETPHTCDPDTLATVALLAKETKPCPKCKTNIYKIDGCDQMWCTICQTPFSWATGQEETGRVHNPHYYEWLRRTKGAVPREPGDQPGADGGCQAGLRHLLGGDINHIGIARQKQWPADRLLYGFHSRILEEAQYNRPPLQNEEKFNRMGIAYLAGEIPKSEWARRVYIEKRAQARIQAVYDIRRAFVGAATDLLNGYLTTTTPFIPTMKAVADLMVYIDDALDRTYDRYFYSGNAKVHVIPEWRVICPHVDVNKLENICGRKIVNFTDIDGPTFTKYVDWILAANL